MICETLRILNDEGKLTAKQLADVLDLATCSAYRYLSGETEPTFSQIRRVFRTSRRDDVQRNLLDVLTLGTGWVHSKIDASNDVNGDGLVNVDDSLDASISALTELSESLTLLRSHQQKGMQKISRDLAARLQGRINKTISHLLSSQQVVEFLTPQTIGAAK